MSTTGATLAFRRRAMGVPKKMVAQRLGVSKDTLADWEAGRLPVPDDVAAAVDEWWQRFIERVEAGIDKTLALLAERGNDVCEGVTVYAYRTPEAHRAAKGDGETLYEHSAVVASIVTGLALRGVQAEVEWRRSDG